MTQSIIYSVRTVLAHKLMALVLRTDIDSRIRCVVAEQVCHLPAQSSLSWWTEGGLYAASQSNAEHCMLGCSNFLPHTVALMNLILKKTVHCKSQWHHDVEYIHSFVGESVLDLSESMYIFENNWCVHMCRNEIPHTECVRACDSM